ncbi:MAG TPA: PhzF family phenazine biosynthesis protein, partial [Spirochaetota bacterium]|nr:PhzF family phenazine biosynthesis protein [Spirochaetota bacterium]
MKLKMYHVDSFTDRPFSGNPAGVCPLPAGWPDDELMQNIAHENNLAETAFYKKDSGGHHIRWFTPTVEVDLCGHATLAAAHIYFTQENIAASSISFGSRSGTLTVRKDDEFLTMNFPTDKIRRVKLSAEINACFGAAPLEVYRGKTDYMLVFDNTEQIANMKFDISAIAKINARGVIITAKGISCDFVSRFFAPKVGVSE